MSKGTTFVGMDVHKASIYVAVAEPSTRDARDATVWQIENKPAAVAKLARKLKAYGDVVTCYEAGPCGFALLRQLDGHGVPCKVIAPALIPQKPGQRIKTDRRDATKLAMLMRAGLLTDVRPPTPAQEAVRDLCRAREDVVEDTMRARHRIVKFLIRHGRSFDGSNWTKLHREWLVKQKFEHAAQQATFDVYVSALQATEERLKSLEKQVEDVAAQKPYAEPVALLRCFRGIDTTTAMIVLSELGDLTRFESPRELMSFLGITPSEHSSGGPDGRRQGGITKAGNGHVRRVLIEAAWQYRHSPLVGKKLRMRRKGQPLWALAIADKCQTRLCSRRRRLTDKGKPANKVNVAVARELAGFIWAMLVEHARKTKAA